MTIDFNTMINYQFSQKLKLIENDEVNNLTIILKKITLTSYAARDLQ